MALHKKQQACAINLLTRYYRTLMLDFHNLTCLLSAFGVLGMRPISFLGNDKLTNLGNDKIDSLVSQYGQAKSHERKCQGGESSIKTVEPFIEPDNTRAEWDSCKRTVIAKVFPRDNMATLWKLICQYHGDKFSNLIKLVSLALTCSAVSNVSGYRCVSDCNSRGHEFDPGLVVHFRGD